MKNIEEILFKVLKYTMNNLKPRSMVNIKKALSETGLAEYIEEYEDIIEELKFKNLAETIEMSVGRVGITRVKLDGKYFVEEYLKKNSSSNLKELDQIVDKVKLPVVVEQLSTARKYLNSTDNSDYRNAVKEAIGAVESTLKIILQDEKIKVGEALKKLKLSHELHPAFSSGISKLYSFSSDSGGIRHGMKEGDYIPNFTDAKFLVLINAAFCNYLIENYL